HLVLGSLAVGLLSRVAGDDADLLAGGDGEAGVEGADGAARLAAAAGDPEGAVLGVEHAVADVLDNEPLGVEGLARRGGVNLDDLEVHGRSWWLPAPAVEFGEGNEARPALQSVEEVG